MNKGIDTLADKTRTGMETAGKEVENLGKNFGTATEEANKLKEKTEELAKTANNELATYKTQVDSIATSWKTASSNITAALTATEEYFKKLGEYDKDYNFDDKGKVKAGDTKGVDTGDKTTGGGGPKEHDLPESPIDYTKYKLYNDEYGTKTTGGTVSNKANYGGKQFSNMYSVSFTGNYDDKTPIYLSSKIGSALPSGYISTTDAVKAGFYTQDEINKIIKEKKEEEDRQNKVMEDRIKRMTSLGAEAFTTSSLNNIPKFNSGGYTGEWGSEGKLAVLHEKELVLNKTDTQNILNIVSMVRGLEQGIMGKISSMLAGLSGLNSNMHIPSITGDNNSSNNVFHITAEFPNADDVVSIKEAILSLPNIASQYISENKK
jgi:hypothetical protein